MKAELSDENIRARIASMTLQERRELVETCERVWNGTPNQWMATLLRTLFEQAKLSLN